MERDPASLQKFKEILAKRESSNDYRAKNRLGYLGKYQFGKDALIDTGYKDRKGNWTGKDGVKSEEDFLNSPEVQEKAMDKHVELNRRYLKNKGATDYIGKNFQGKPVTESGLVGAAHLVGAGGVSKMLKTGKVPKDAFGTEATEYLNLLNNISLEDERKMDKLKKLEGLKKELNGLGIAPEMQERVGKEFNEGGLMTEEEILKAQVNPTPEQARYLNRAQQIEGELSQSEPRMSLEPEAPKQLTGIEKLIEDYRKEKEAFKSRQSTADNMSALSSIASTFDKYSPNSVGLQAQQFDAGMAPSLNETINLAKLKGLSAETPLTEYQKQALDLRKRELEAKGKRKKKEPTFEEKEKTKQKVKQELLDTKEEKEIKKEAESALGALDSQEQYIDQALSLLKAGGSTGPIDQFVAKFTKDGQKLQKALNNIALDKMVKMFSGMSKAIDSDSERAFFQSTQPSMSDYEDVNVETLKQLKNNIESLRNKTKAKLGKDEKKPSEKKEQKVLAKKFYSKKSNKTKLVYSDGSEEIVDGRQ